MITSEELYKRIISLHNAGYKIPEIAKKVRLNESTVRNIINRQK